MLSADEDDDHRDDDHDGRRRRFDQRVEAHAVAAAALAATAAAAAALLAQAIPDRHQGVHFVDPAGATWYVHERSALYDAGAHDATCLVFDSGEVMRRVWAYPDDWRELPAEALLALSWRT